MTTRTYFVGETVELGVDFTDENGQPVDVTDVVCTVLLPDESTETPTVDHDALGTYTAKFTPALNGLHQYRFAANGVPPIQGATEGAFLAQTAFPS